MAAHLAATLCSRHSRGQARRATADGAAGHSRSRQAPFSRHNYRQPAQSADCPKPSESQLHTSRAGPAWAGDITCIATEEGRLFLGEVIDLFSRRVVGWSMQPDCGAT